MGSLWAHTGAIGCIVLKSLGTVPRVAYGSSIGWEVLMTARPSNWGPRTLGHVQWNPSGHPWIEDTSLIRTRDQVPTAYKYVLFAPWNEDTSLIRTHFIGPRVSVLERFHCITPVTSHSLAMVTATVSPSTQLCTHTFHAIVSVGT